MPKKFSASTAKISPWNNHGLQPISEAPVQELVVARKFLDAAVMAPKACHRGK
jgi:hypothetical protein